MVPCAGRLFEELTHFFVSAFVSLGAKPRCDSSTPVCVYSVVTLLHNLLSSIYIYLSLPTIVLYS